MGNTQRGFLSGRWLAFALLVLAGLAMLALEASRQTEMKRLRERTLTLQQDVETAQIAANAALAAIIAPDIISAAAQSVYLIVVNGDARGTAFVVDRQNGVLATAAHTADSLPLGEDGAEIYLLNRFSDRRIPVSGKRLHRGFGAFRVEVENHQPIRKNSSIYAPQAAPLRDLAFDVALLTADAIDPDTGENSLGPDLAIADEEALLSLEAGSAIAVIGYPYDTLDNGFAPDAGTARVERGVIAAMTPPLDTIAEARNPVTANLIIHRLATAGGNSGSPVIDATGAVIGVHTHGIESASSNADGAAQRADSLLDLLSETREAERLAGVFLPAWQTMLSHWARAEDVLPWSFYMEYARPGETPAPLVSSIESVAAAPFSHAIDIIEFDEPAERRRVEAPDLSAASVESSDNINAEGKSFLIDQAGQYAETWRTVDRRSEHVIFAFDYSLRSRTGFCPLTVYWRKKGDARLRAVRGRASFELHLPPAGDAVEDYQIVFRRSDRCDPLSNQFMIGSVSWDAGEEDAVQTASMTSGGEQTSEANWRKDAAGFFAPLRKGLNRFVECRVKSGENIDLCQPPEYVELDQGAGD